MISSEEAILFILIIGFGISIVSLEIHARRQAKELALLQAQFQEVEKMRPEIESMRGWALQVNAVLTRQCMINGEVQKRIFGNEEAPTNEE